jgi:hypothetical protein
MQGRPFVTLWRENSNRPRVYCAAVVGATPLCALTGKRRWTLTMRRWSTFLA